VRPIFISISQGPKLLENRGPSMPSPLASAVLPILVLFPIYIVLNVTSLGEYSTSWLILSLACGTPFSCSANGRDVVHSRGNANFLWRIWSTRPNCRQDRVIIPVLLVGGEYNL
jgi:hypothetical protein